MVEHICTGRPGGGGGTTILTIGGVTSEGAGGPGGVDGTTIPSLGGGAAEGMRGSGSGPGVNVCRMHVDGTHGSNVPVSCNGVGGGRASCCDASRVAVSTFTDLNVSAARGISGSWSSPVESSSADSRQILCVVLACRFLALHSSKEMTGSGCIPTDTSSHVLLKVSLT